MSESILTKKLGWKEIVASSVVSAYFLAAPIFNPLYHLIDSRNYTGCARQAIIDRIYRAEILIPGSCFSAEDKWREWNRPSSSDVGTSIIPPVEIKTEKPDWNKFFK